MNNPVLMTENANTDATTTNAIRTMAVSRPVMPRWSLKPTLDKGFLPLKMFFNCLPPNEDSNVSQPDIFPFEGQVVRKKGVRISGFETRSAVKTGDKDEGLGRQA